eukprot:6157195-Prymnesium_polylepis.1
MAEARGEEAPAEVREEEAPAEVREEEAMAEAREDERAEMGKSAVPAAMVAELAATAPMVAAGRRPCTSRFSGCWWGQIHLA